MGHRQDIGSLGALFSFEAAGRLGSFTRAAAELGVSQAAVSKQVANLEASLGQPLFQRGHREVRLTGAGTELFRVTTVALASIGQSMRSLRRNEAVQPITIAASMATSHLWLMPLLTAFKRSNPDVAIRLLSDDTAVDLRTGAADIAIRFGDGAWQDGRATLLFAGVVYPMASNSLIDARGMVDTVDDLLDWPWIAYDTPDRSWVSWNDWLSAAGCKAPPGRPTLSCTRYLDALQAACAGQGLVLVWGGVTGGIEEGGRLVRLPGPAYSSRGNFYLVRSAQTEAKPGCAFLADWLTREALSQRLVTDPNHGLR